MLRLFFEARDPVVFVDFRDAEPACLAGRNLERRNRDVRVLLRSFSLCGDRDRGCGIWWANKLKSFHRMVPSLYFQ